MTTFEPGTYAVRLTDLSGIDLDRRMAAMAVAPVQGELIEVQPEHLDAGTAVVLDCDEERAAAIVEVIRLRCDRNRVRIYRQEKKGWKRI